ncbi:hypothetical protein NHH03_19845 [Stieleria sp. TO1_6]|uniref:hypothetical protein n=1 Tax=Stieleria tagensis TaxID=2956795 RepID=UPI00209AAEE3|nr:hypothetical protein [Stieleria tagensis]MCO8124007.1 hypothetical protein [Stieleria tagensis]
MTPDELDRLIRHADPVDSGDSDALLESSRLQWTQLRQRRASARKRLTLSLAALGLFAMLGGITAWVTSGNQRPGKTVAENTVVDHTKTTQTPSTEVVVAALPETANKVAAPSVAASDEVVSGAAKTAPPEDMPETMPETIQPEPAPSEASIAFANWVDQAGPVDGAAWRQARVELMRQDDQTQRATIRLVPQLEDARQRARGFLLVTQAAGASQSALLRYWLDDPRMRSLAWRRLTETASLDQAAQMVSLARNNEERLAVCQAITAAGGPQAVMLLLELTHSHAWRTPVRMVCNRLQPTQIRSLVMLMRERDVALRTAAAFLLASVPGRQLDQSVAQMIVDGRFRQPAYLVLLARDTPQARAFLAQAAAQPELTPALVSARAHFATMEEQLQRWIKDSKGTYDEQTETTQPSLPKLAGGADFDRRRSVAS